MYGAGSIALTSVLAGCSGGSGGDNGSGNGTGTKGGTATEAATDTAANTESGTELTDSDTDTDTDTETKTDSATETDDETETDADTETGTETEEPETDDDDDDDDDDENYDGRDSERLTYGEIRQQPPSTLDNLNQEYVELINASGSTIDLSGYTITYGDGATYTFDDGFELAVDQPVTVHTGSGDDSDTDVYVGRDEVALDYQGPDKVTVKNADGTVVLEATA
ncbi:endonuclease [Halococcus thailandensis JCM 13552]|uniref:Endonuclease n=1 Tax=Halococcus thailandensis JCM 13552 TaxID=1227457 RepID=M0N5G6_9EURY|nr:endonuclease [Halococcus thailandensis JCM 13552]